MVRSTDVPTDEASNVFIATRFDTTSPARAEQKGEYATADEAMTALGGTDWTFDGNNRWYRREDRMLLEVWRDPPNRDA